MDETANAGHPALLSYQTNRPLDDVPAYAVGLQVRLSSGEKIYIALSTTELALYFEAGIALHYDLEARLTKVAEENQYWRRSLSHRVLYSRKRTAEEGGGLDRVAMSSEEADKVVDQSHRSAERIYHEIEAGLVEIEYGKPDANEARQRLLPLLERAAKFDVPAARQDAERFAQIYGRVSILPSDDYNAFVLQATEGCGFGGCLFCELYDGVRYHVKDPAEFDRHVRAAVAYHGESLRTRRNIYLGEANALNAPQRTVTDIFRVLHEHFEFPPPGDKHIPASWWLGRRKRFAAVHAFMDVFTGEPRTALDWTELRRLGLRRVYIGMETGCDALLKWLRKPSRADLIRRAVVTLKEADINVGMILLLGAGGHEFYPMHVEETVHLLNELPLGTGDYVYFSPLVVYEGGPYAAAVEKSGIHCLNNLQMRQQEAEIRAQLRFDQHRGKPYLARYEIETFVY